MKRILPWFAGAAVTVLVICAAAWPFVSVVDVLTGRVSNLASVDLLHGGRVEVRQQWDGDFYRVELCHSLTNGTRLTCVVDPDTFRIKRCQLTLEPTQPLVLVACDRLPLATYDCRTHVLVRGSGGRVTAHD